MRAALAIFALLLSLAVAEVLLRVLDLPQFDACDTTADYAIADPLLGFRAAPNGVVTGVRLNRLGMRGPEIASPKPAGERRLLFIGDSTCWGLGVELPEAFAARATARLGDPHARFLLGAFPGYSSYHSAVLLDELLPLQPDLVVFYVGARNDGSRARYFADAEIPARRARLEATWHRVKLLRLMEVAVDRSYRSWLRKLRSRTSRARVPPEAFRANMNRMLDRLAERGVPAIVVLPPLSHAFERDQPQMAVYRDILRQIAAQRGAPLVDVDEAFAEADEARLYFEDGFHLAPAGHAIVGDALFEVIERL